ncbi:MAG TPA: acyl-CoA desaturase [Polyangiaceae bacterium]|jgi:linoleoyl-CoA desaturase
MLAEQTGVSAPVCAPPRDRDCNLAVDPRHLPDPERYRLFGEELDALKQRTQARVGPDDVTYVRRMNRFSRAMEVLGRGLIFFSPEPLSFLVGVGALFLHKQLQATEIGHTALHGAYDRLPGAEKFSSKAFRWDIPIDEEAWRYAHNVKHHGNTNIAGKDPDIAFGHVRLTEQTPWNRRHSTQLLVALTVIFPNFTFFIGAHAAGLNDVFIDNGLPEKFDILPDRSKESVRGAWKKGLRKYVPYYLYNYVLWPALAGPMFWKVLLGNWLAETARNVYSAATIFCGHVGEDVASYPPGTRAHGRGEWYAMQIEAANDFEVSWPVSVLCGGLDMQIEHHLFPQLAPQRLREIAPEVRDLCEKYGVEYRTDTWGRTLKKALAYVGELGKRGGVREVVRSMA